jgi:soluble lytic murein transglycosylase-like protein
MTASTLLAFEILRMMAAPSTPALRARAAVAAVVIQHAAETEGVDARRLAAVAMKESSFRPWVVGKRGEVGMMQILPGRRSRRACAGLDLSRPLDNARCGARLLREAAARCGDSPLAYLPAYNGPRCGDPDGLPVYAVRVLTIEARGRGGRWRIHRSRSDTHEGGG